MTCSACAAELPSAARFCPTCGASQDEPVEAASRGEDSTGEVPMVAAPPPPPGASTSPRPAAPPAEPADATRALSRPVDAAPPASESRSPSPTPRDTTSRLLPLEHDAEATRACPRCQGIVPEARLLCPHCGATVDGAGAALPPPPPVHRDGPGGRVVGTPMLAGRQRPRRMLVTVAGVVLASAVVGTGAAWVLTRTGGDPVDEVAGPVFDPAAFPTDPEQLVVTRIGANGSLDEVAAGPALLVDGDDTTSWHGVAPTAEGGVAIAFELDGDAWVRRVVVVNGGDGVAAVPAVRLLDGGVAVVDVALLPTATPQAVDLPVPILARRLDVAVLPGEGGVDGPVGMAEFELFGHPIASDAAGEPEG